MTRPLKETHLSRFAQLVRSYFVAQTGVMEYWSGGVVYLKPNTPTLLYSNIPFFVDLASGAVLSGLQKKQIEAS
jgi:hypothetical protein